ncbi:hypothetical protein DFJ58DRAFT_866604 [Suillus subalutaceus]|uniref:uncharacterized protein n=1 Tax=Suillus subalutaceus TaxID=48586 RepID=UPI001B85EAB2|nr:uncharacterized protein DFJ58DRAFT_866604 [Suillus subalutaceus]KAG1836050.1 hypothetical protein DFJ58DRAFT_866604 [Suillus subalutaceus]
MYPEGESPDTSRHSPCLQTTPNRGLECQNKLHNLVKSSSFQHSQKAIRCTLYDGDALYLTPWTPSYSIITQGPGVPVEEHVTLGDLEEPHPKSPWTSSYSVTVQGNVAQANEGLDDLEQLPPSATQSVAAEGVEEQPVPFVEEALISSEAFTPVEEVFEEEIERGSFIVEDESLQLGTIDPGEERSSSPWTPSYSVSAVEPASALEDQAVAEDDEFVEHGSFIIETQSSDLVEDAQVKSDLGLL